VDYLDSRAESEARRGNGGNEPAAPSATSASPKARSTCQPAHA